MCDTSIYGDDSSDGGAAATMRARWHRECRASVPVEISACGASRKLSVSLSVLALLFSQYDASLVGSLAVSSLDDRPKLRCEKLDKRPGA